MIFLSVVIYVFLVFLSVLGLCEVIHFLSLSLLDNKKNRNKVVCLVLRGRTADIELQFVVEQFRWMGRKYADKIIAINALDTDEEMLNRCSEIALKNGIEIISFDNVSKQLFEDADE